MNDMFIATLDKYPGQFFLLDLDNVEFFLSKSWFANQSYLSTNRGHKSFSFHRLIIRAGKYDHVDHINRYRFDNRKSNLRIVSKTQNNQNKVKQKGCSSVYYGVYFEKINKKWRAEINVEGKKRRLGFYTVEIEAAKAYDKAAREVYGIHARVNFPI